MRHGFLGRASAFAVGVFCLVWLCGSDAAETNTWRAWRARDAAAFREFRRPPRSAEPAASAPKPLPGMDGRGKGRASLITSEMGEKLLPGTNDVAWLQCFPLFPAEYFVYDIAMIDDVVDERCWLQVERTDYEPPTLPEEGEEWDGDQFGVDWEFREYHELTKLGERVVSVELSLIIELHASVAEAKETLRRSVESWRERDCEVSMLQAFGDGGYWIVNIPAPGWVGHGSYPQLRDRVALIARFGNCVVRTHSPDKRARPLIRKLHDELVRWVISRCAETLSGAE